MRWEGAAKRSEGSRAWGCKHCRGREEGIGRNRSQRWVDTEYVSATANRSAPLPRQSDVPTWAEYYVLMNRTRASLAISASQSFFSLSFAVLKLILMYKWDTYILQELPRRLERNVVNHFGVFLISEGILCLCGGVWGRLCSISSDRVDITPRQAPTKENKWPDKPVLSV